MDQQLFGNGGWGQKFEGQFKGQFDLRWVQV